MRWNVFMTIQGPARTLEVPNQFNPIESDSIKTLLVDLASVVEQIAQPLKVVGLRIELVEEEEQR